jgi:Cd2+/Zn2+-exporting ATPase/Cu+-exporting ATPase
MYKTNTVETSVGVAMAQARKSVDVVLLGHDLVRFIETLRLAWRVRWTSWQNFAGYASVGAPLCTSRIKT